MLRALPKAHLTPGRASLPPRQRGLTGATGVCGVTVMHGQATNTVTGYRTWNLIRCVGMRFWRALASGIRGSWDCGFAGLSAVLADPCDLLINCSVTHQLDNLFLSREGRSLSQRQDQLNSRKRLSPSDPVTHPPRQRQSMMIHVIRPTAGPARYASAPHLHPPLHHHHRSTSPRRRGLPSPSGRYALHGQGAPASRSLPPRYHPTAAQPPITAPAGASHRPPPPAWWHAWPLRPPRRSPPPRSSRWRPRHRRPRRPGPTRRAAPCLSATPQCSPPSGRAPPTRPRAACRPTYSARRRGGAATRCLGVHLAAYGWCRLRVRAGSSRLRPPATVSVATGRRLASGRRCRRPPRGACPAAPPPRGRPCRIRSRRSRRLSRRPPPPAHTPDRRVWRPPRRARTAPSAAHSPGRPSPRLAPPGPPHAAPTAKRRVCRAAASTRGRAVSRGRPRLRLPSASMPPRGLSALRTRRLASVGVTRLCRRATRQGCRSPSAAATRRARRCLRTPLPSTRYP